MERKFFTRPAALLLSTQLRRTLQRSVLYSTIISLSLLFRRNILWVENDADNSRRSIGTHCANHMQGSAIHHDSFDYPVTNCIFIKMKTGAYIFSAIFLLVFSLLHIQPLFGNSETKKEQSCAKSKCHKQMPCQKKSDSSDEKNDCANRGCNPFVPCPMGSCCYVVENFFTHNAISFIKKQKLLLFDDNTLLNGLSKCWHPPEVIS
jgi:hypothetical protein